MSEIQSEAVENFLKAVYVLQQKMERVSTNALAESLGRKAPTITDMVRRMEDAGLLHYRKYHGVMLTETGENIALKIIRRHRLIELYLVEELNYGLHEVHDEAESLEHAVSDRFIDAIAEKLGHPEVDPHGDPIPDADGVMLRRELIPLTEIPLHTVAKVARYRAESADMLQHLLDRDLQLDAEVEVLARDPFEGPLTMRVNGSQRIMGHNAADCILVEIMKPA